MATAVYSSQFLSTHQPAWSASPSEWLYANPTVEKVMRHAVPLFLAVGLIALGVGALLASSPLLVLGAAACVAMIIGAVALDILSGSPHMTSHVFPTGSCAGGTLSYHGDIPILKLDGTNPRQAGFAQGYLLGNAIRLTHQNTVYAVRMKRDLEARAFLETVKQTIPQEYMQEMEGLVEGYNQWVREQNAWLSIPEMTLDDVLIFHLWPDSHSFLTGSDFDTTRLGMEGIGCTTSILDWDPEKGPILGSNRQALSPSGSPYPSQYSFIKCVNKGSIHTIEVTIPGMIGTYTGMNQNGFALMMDLCPSDVSSEIRGMPVLFYNRSLLEQCRYISDVRRILQRPLSSCNRTLADSVQQQAQRIVTNIGRVTLVGGDYQNEDPNDSSKRKQLLTEFYSGAGELSREGLLEEALRLPGIANKQNTQTVIMNPRERKMRISFCGGFAAGQPLLEVPVQQLFEQEANSH